MHRRRFLRSALALSAFAGTSVLAACSLGQAATPAPQPTTGAGLPTTLPTALATNAPTSVAAATVVPSSGSVGNPTAVTAATAALPTPVPPPAALLGPEWNVLASGHLYRDGIETAIGFIGSNAPIFPAPAGYADFTVVASQVAIVQRNSAGQPWVRVHMTTGGTVLNGGTSSVPIQGGPDSRTAALRLSFPTTYGALSILPVGGDGQPTAAGVRFDYNSLTRNFEIYPIAAPGGPAHDPNEWPGNGGWQDVTMGDYDGDNKVEHVYYRPSNVVPDPSFSSPAYAAYTLVASDVMIAQGDATNNSVLAQITLQGVRSDTMLLNLTTDASTPDNTPAAFLLAAPSQDGLPLAVIPINANGQGYMQGFGLAWDAGAGAYRIAGPPRS